MAINLHFKVTGISCYSCVLAIKKLFVTITDILDINVSEDLKTIHFRVIDGCDIKINRLNAKLENTKFNLSEIAHTIPTLFEQYFPICQIAVTCLLISQILLPIYHHIPQVFMAFWLILFAQPKLQNITGFQKLFSKYDIISSRFSVYGFVFPFLELGLGLLYLIPRVDHRINYLTIGIFSMLTFSVLKVMLKKQDINCACLGENSKMKVGIITLLENITMVGMSLLMLAGY
jgi:hypothetical protein